MDSLDKEYLKAIKDYTIGISIFIGSTILLGIIQLVYDNWITKYLILTVLVILLIMNKMFIDKLNSKINKIE